MFNKALKKAKENKKGFTLAELLIVVAIIAVLVAISIPIFTAQLEKSREAVDAANIRAMYAELMSDVLTGDYDTTANAYQVTLKQQTADWQNSDYVTSLGTEGTGMTLSGTPHKDGTATLTYSNPTDGTAGTVTCTFS